MSVPFRVRLRDESSPALAVEASLSGGPGHHLRVDRRRRSPSADPEPGELIVHECRAAWGALESLEGAWRALTPPSAAPFQTWGWNVAWYRSYADRRMRPLLFERRLGGVTVAILPAYREGRAVRLAGDRICDYQDAIALDRVEAAALLRQAQGWLSASGGGGPFRFERVSSEGLLRSLLGDATMRPGASLIFEKSSAPCPCADLCGGLEGYLASLPRRTRQDFRHSLKRLEKEAPEAEISILRDYEIRVEDLCAAASFHAENFRRAGRSPLGDPRLLALLGQVAKDPEVGLQLAFLRRGGDTLAVDIGFARAGRYYGYLTAYDPAHGRLAPGKCLLLKRIDRWVEEDGVATLDFLAGDEAYKRVFTGDRHYRIWSMRLMPDGPGNRLRLAALETDKGLRRLAKRVLGIVRGGTR